MNLSITDDITFRKLTILMMLVEKGNIARTAEALNTLEENVRGPLFVHKGLFGTRPRYKDYRCGRQHRNRSLRYVI
ncbi:ABC transporter ATPase [Salmonella enterica subsp. enterica]|uniref:ABC transporter ATPase n=1 Tax=Salmonella enterica I TaxID=59201 RepID=A0A379WKJ6_SALET|nr:ABC transporter ATPase [Salmonella enterica subsp. enterica]